MKELETDLMTLYRHAEDYLFRGGLEVLKTGK